MSLPNLERGGWEPGMRWVADSPEQQHDLDIRYEAEEIADRVHFLMGAMHGEDDDEGAEEDEFYDREESVQKSINHLLAIESYNSRSLDIVLRDTLSWIDVIKDESDRYHARHTVEREAASLLTRAVEHPEEKSEVDETLLGLAVQWASIEFFMYNYWRDWDYVSREKCLETIEQAGVTKEQLNELLKAPKDEEAAKIKNENEEMYIHGANQIALEAQMLRRAKEVGIEVGKVHNYSNFLQGMGI